MSAPSQSADPNAKSGALSRQIALSSMSTVRPQKIINVKVGCALWVNWDVNDEVLSNSERDVAVQNYFVWYKMLSWRLEGLRIPVIAEENCIGKIAD
jgi:hypothetical protein